MEPRIIEKFCSNVLEWPLSLIPNFSSGLASVIVCPLPLNADSTRRRPVNGEVPRPALRHHLRSLARPSACNGPRFTAELRTTRSEDEDRFWDGASASAVPRRLDGSAPVPGRPLGGGT